MRAQPSYSTGELGSFLGVCRNTVIKLIDNGTIAHFRPPGKDCRRVWHADLIAFLKSRPDLRPMIAAIEAPPTRAQLARRAAPAS